jgi:hypothetical protein
MQITAEEIAARVPRDGQIHRWNLRECSLCGVPVGYQFLCVPGGEPVAAFDSSCDCTRYSNLSPRSFADVAGAINMQRRPEIFEQMRAELYKALRSATPPLRFVYTNHKGESSARTVTPLSVRFGTSEWYPEPTWLLLAYDHAREADREFAMWKMQAIVSVSAKAWAEAAPADCLGKGGAS